ncbi:MAG TPA: hypothetical protein VH413_03270 [Verrucomicrobiae bacterium]|jgi:hypothetical protein|nr:hypothetical protein [Verrucomicrobiae bacterium]
MSAHKPTPRWLSVLCLTLGLIFVLGALYGMTDTGMKGYALWKKAHAPVAAVTPPPKTPVNPKAPKTASPAAPAPKVHISMDAIAPLAEYFIAELVMFFIGVRLLQVPGKKAKAAKEAAAFGETSPVSAVAAKTARASAKRWQSSNVLQVGAESRRLWSFGAAKGGFTLAQDQNIPTAAPLPPNVVGRDWTALFQPKLNIAWLPVEQVFLRVAQLPIADFDETLSMVELQLEKLSPLPVTQIVWSIQVLPQRVDNLQTIIVIIMARDLVEKFLGELEGQGFLADRLELPILDQMQATAVKADGAYIYPDATTGKLSALVAWWYGGTLRNLGLLHVPAGERREAVLREQLTQMAWSGELEGWLTSAPRWFLVADEDTAVTWEPLFRSWLGTNLEVLRPAPPTQLATLNANRAARAESGAGILPPEYATRYQQEFVDRLWMRGLGVVLAAYLGGVTIYLAGAAVQSYRAETLVEEVSSHSRAYTNVLQLKAQLGILQNRQALKFASLDCWKKTAELLPENISIGTLEFKDGKHYSLSGTAQADQSGALTDFNEALRKATLDGEPMFETLSLPQIKLNPGGATLSWSFNGDLARAEEAK